MIIERAHKREIESRNMRIDNEEMKRQLMRVW